MPRVSVVMPCYNAELYLREAIQSVLDQTFEDYEIVAVDDGSTDGTRTVVEAFDDSRLRYIYRENGGPGAARNTGISAARGEYIAPLDADDLALPHRLSSQLAALDAEPTLSVVGSGYEWIDGAGQHIPWERHSWQRFPDLDGIRGWLFDCPVVPSATMLRRAAWEDVEGFDETLIGPEDWNFWLRLILQGHRIGWHKEVVCLYRHRPDGLSHQAQRMLADCSLVLRQVMERPDFPPELLEAGTQALALRYIDGTKRLFWAGQWPEGEAALEEALRLYPELMSGQPSRVEDELLSAALDPIVNEPMGFLRTLFDYLPKAAVDLQSRRQHVLTRAHVELLARGVQLRDPRMVLKHLGPWLMTLPRGAFDRGTWAFYARAVVNRVWELGHRVRQRLR
ncbi:glycosyltransferase family 2 protein [Chloroflexota bacterium]